MIEGRSSPAHWKRNPVLAQQHAEHLARLQRINSAPLRIGQGARRRIIPNLEGPTYMGPADAHVKAYREWIEQICASRPDAVTAAMVIAAATKITGYSREEILGRCRKARLVIARHLAMKIYQDRSQKSILEIGRRFGGRDHTTALFACKRMGEMVAADPKLAETMDAINREIDLTLEQHAAIRAWVMS